MALSSGYPHLQCKCPPPCCCLWPTPNSRVVMSEFDPKGPGFKLGYGLGFKSCGFPAGQFPITPPTRVGETWPQIQQVYPSPTVTFPHLPVDLCLPSPSPLGLVAFICSFPPFPMAGGRSILSRIVLNSYQSLSRSLTPLSLWIWLSWMDSVPSGSPAPVNWIVLVLPRPFF